MSLLDDLARRRYILLCYAISFVHFAQWQGLSPFVPIYATELGATPAQAGLVVSLFGALPFLLAIPAGVLADRVGHRILFILGTAGTGAAGLVLQRADGLWTLGAAVGLIGVSQLLIVVGAQTFIAVAAPDKDAGFGYLTLLIGLGRTVGPVLCGWVKEFSGYHAVFTGFLAVSLLPILLALFLPRGEWKSRHTRGTGDQKSNWVTILVGGSLTALYCSFAVNIAIGAYDSVYALYLHHLGLGAGAIGLLFSVQNATSIFIRPLIGWTVRLLGRYWLLALAMLGSFVGLASTVIVDTLPLLALCAGLFGLAKGASQPVTMAIIADSVPVERRGTAIGVRISVNRLGQTISPVILGGIAGAAGFPAAFLGAGTVLLIGAAAALRPALMGTGLERPSATLGGNTGHKG
ncbi:MAG: MFS transporter [Bacillota bacterium]|nr:MFS transporter [Bacillota bacterium]